MRTKDPTSDDLYRNPMYELHTDSNTACTKVRRPNFDVDDLLKPSASSDAVGVVEGFEGCGFEGG